MRLTISFLVIFFYLTPYQTMAGEKINNPLSIINNYKDFLVKSCTIIHEKTTRPFFLGVWQLKYQNKNEVSYVNKLSNQEAQIKIITRNSSNITFRYTFYNNSQPELFLVANQYCVISIARLIRRDSNNKITSITTLSENLSKETFIEHLNPEVPAVDPTTGIKVALIDTGINYLLPEITKNIARKTPKELFGYDFEDGDQLPFDLDFVGSPFFPRHHGTSVASILIREAPFVQIVPYRFSRKNSCSFKDIITEIKKLKIKVVLLPMGSRNIDTWKCFNDEAKKQKEILFIVSAGNQNLNIDIERIFPASLPLDNMLVISSSTIFGNLASGSNYGAKNVDIIVHAEQIRVIDHRGIKSIASGSSFAVPRIGAMIARFLRFNPQSKVEEIIDILRRRTIPVESNFVKLGWIPDPLDNYLFQMDSK